MHIRRIVRGLDEMALEVAWLSLAVALGLVLWAVALNSGPAGRLTSLPVIGPAVGGLRQLFGLVVHQ